jgi:hypothetical protein
MKDGPAEEEVISRLETVEIDFDEAEEVITSCVIVPIENVPDRHDEPEQSQAGIALQALFDALSQLAGGG